MKKKMTTEEEDEDSILFRFMYFFSHVQLLLLNNFKIPHPSIFHNLTLSVSKAIRKTHTQYFLRELKLFKLLPKVNTVSGFKDVSRALIHVEFMPQIQ